MLVSYKGNLFTRQSRPGPSVEALTLVDASLVKTALTATCDNMGGARISIAPIALALVSGR